MSEHYPPNPNALRDYPLDDPALEAKAQTAMEFLRSDARTQDRFNRGSLSPIEVARATLLALQPGPAPDVDDIIDPESVRGITLHRSPWGTHIRIDYETADAWAVDSPEPFPTPAEAVAYLGAKIR